MLVKKSSFFRALAALLLAVTAPGLSAAPAETDTVIRLQGPERLVQGEAAVFFLQAGGEILEAEAALRNGEQKTALSFAVFPLPDGNGEWAAVAGIPSTLPPGDYLLHARVLLKDDGEKRTRAPVGITARDFVFEDIPLSLAMSELRTDPDPRKIEEARELYRILGRGDPSAVYHTGRFLRPVEEFRETSFYGDRRTYLYSDGGRAGAIHQGIDYATPRGTPVSAAGAGRVVMARERIMTGLTVALEHLPGVFSLYYHLDRIVVEEGGMVAPGERIGLSGATGLVTGPHLHWEVRAAGNAVEPKSLLTRGLLDKNALFGMMREDSEKGR